VVGLTPLNPEKKTASRTNVEIYFSTESAEETTKKVRENGGTVIVEPMSVNDFGIMASYQDPDGASFNVWQPLKHKGMNKYEDPPRKGILGWSEYYSRNPTKAFEFYSAVFGFERIHDPEHNYWMWYLEDEITVCGCMDITDEEWGDLPPHWMTYFTVDDVSEAIEKLKSLGGNVCFGPMDVPGMLKFGMVDDGQGVSFSISKNIGSQLDRELAQRKKVIRLTKDINNMESALKKIESLVSSEKESSLAGNVLNVIKDTKSCLKRKREENGEEENPAVKKCRKEIE